MSQPAGISEVVRGVITERIFVYPCLGQCRADSNHDGKLPPDYLRTIATSITRARRSGSTDLFLFHGVYQGTN
jgi:hypothetical protein